MTNEQLALLENVLGAALGRLITGSTGYLEADSLELQEALDLVRKERGRK